MREFHDSLVKFMKQRFPENYVIMVDNRSYKNKVFYKAHDFTVEDLQNTFDKFDSHVSITSFKIDKLITNFQDQIRQQLDMYDASADLKELIEQKFLTDVDTYIETKNDYYSFFKKIESQYVSETDLLFINEIKRIIKKNIQDKHVYNPVLYFLDIDLKDHPKLFKQFNISITSSPDDENYKYEIFNLNADTKRVLAEHIIEDLNIVEITEPNFIVFTGNGIHIWYVLPANNNMTFNKFKAFQNEFIENLKTQLDIPTYLEADLLFDLGNFARMTKIPGGINPKNNQRVELIYENSRGFNKISSMVKSALDSADLAKIVENTQHRKRTSSVAIIDLFNTEDDEINKYYNLANNEIIRFIKNHVKLPHILSFFGLPFDHNLEYNPTEWRTIKAPYRLDENPSFGFCDSIFRVKDFAGKLRNLNIFEIELTWRGDNKDSLDYFDFTRLIYSIVNILNKVYIPATPYQVIYLLLFIAWKVWKINNKDAEFALSILNLDPEEYYEDKKLQMAYKRLVDYYNDLETTFQQYTIQIRNSLTKRLELVSKLPKIMFFPPTTDDINALRYRDVLYDKIVATVLEYYIYTYPIFIRMVTTENNEIQLEKVYFYDNTEKIHKDFMQDNPFRSKKIETFRKELINLFSTLKLKTLIENKSISTEAIATAVLQLLKAKEKDFASALSNSISHIRHLQHIDEAFYKFTDALLSKFYELNLYSFAHSLRNYQDSPIRLIINGKKYLKTINKYVVYDSDNPEEIGETINSSDIDIYVFENNDNIESVLPILKRMVTLYYSNITDLNFNYEYDDSKEPERFKALLYQLSDVDYYFDEELGKVIVEKDYTQNPRYNLAIQAINYMLGHLFYAPHNDTRALFLKGEGANGKSTLSDVLDAVLQPRVALVPAESFLTGETKSNAKKNLVGKLLCISQDSNIRDVSSDFKSLISGESVEVKELYKDVYTTRLTTKFIINLNNIPNFHGSGPVSYRRRILFVEIKNKIEAKNRDPYFKDKVLKEKPYILAYIIKQAKKYKQGGIHAFLTAEEREILERNATRTSAYEEFIKENLYILPKDLSTKIHSIIENNPKTYKNAEIIFRKSHIGMLLSKARTYGLKMVSGYEKAMFMENIVNYLLEIQNSQKIEFSDRLEDSMRRANIKGKDKINSIKDILFIIPTEINENYKLPGINKTALSMLLRDINITLEDFINEIKEYNIPIKEEG